MARIDAGRVTRVVRLANERVEEFESLLPDVEHAALAGVNPPLEAALAKVLAPRFGDRLLHIEPALGVGLVNLCRAPERVGLDRLLACRAALERTEDATVVADFGTAATFNLVTPPGVFRGGLIAPGLALGARARAGGAAALPGIAARSGLPPLVGLSTDEAIDGGTYWTAVGGLERFVAGVTRALGRRPVVLATGGDAERVAAGTPAVDQVVLELVLEGIWHVWRDRRGGE